jgi:hypothetical protein
MIASLSFEMSARIDSDPSTSYTPRIIFDEESYLWIVLEDAMKRLMLSGDQELAIGVAMRSRQAGIEDGNFLRREGSTIPKVSVVVVASISSGGVSVQGIDATRRINNETVT